MKALLLEETCDLRESPEPLRMADIPDPRPADGEVLVEVSVCGICHTELDEIEGRMPPAKLPVVLGHQAVGRIVAVGRGVPERSGEGGPPRIGERVGVGWIFHACGACRYCRNGSENLCPDFRATGRDANGGYAELMTVPATFVHRIPESLEDATVAPLLCAGAIGYRSLRLSGIGPHDRLGLTGFGASGHLVLQLARHRLPETEVYVFARDPGQRAFALELGAAWAGGTEDTAPEPLHAIIDTTPVWKPVVEALRNLAPGGRLVVNAIRKEAADREDLLRLDYATHLWLEKEIKSVANVTRRDVREFLELAAAHPIAPEIEIVPMEDANQALVDLRRGGGRGARVLRIAP